jgi:hypothetical protein
MTPAGSTVDPSVQAGYRRMLARRGQWVIVRRISGDAPSTTVFNAMVLADVQDYQPKTPVSEVKPEGGITLGARNVILLAADLAAASFVLPVTKNDKIVLNPSSASLGKGTANGDEELNIMIVDANKRLIAGAIDIVAEGV